MFNRQFLLLPLSFLVAIFWLFASFCHSQTIQVHSKPNYGRGEFQSSGHLEMRYTASILPLLTLYRLTAVILTLRVWEWILVSPKFILNTNPVSPPCPRRYHSLLGRAWSAILWKSSQAILTPSLLPPSLSLKSTSQMLSFSLLLWLQLETAISLNQLILDVPREPFLCPVMPYSLRTTHTVLNPCFQN